MSKLGLNNINKIYLGSTEINKVYLGSNLIYGNTVTTPNFAFGLQNIGSFSGNVIENRDTNTSSETDQTANSYLTQTPVADITAVTLYNQGSTAMTNQLEQTSATAQPNGYTSGSINTDSNGNPVLKFDGINDFLETNDSNLLALNTGVSPEHSIILVCEFDTVPSATEVLYEFRQNGDTDDLCRFHYTTTTGELQVLYRDPNRTVRYQENCGSISANTQYIIEIYVGSVLNVFVNGTQVVTNVAQATTIAHAPDSFGYGSNGDGSNNWFDGALKEIQLFDSNKLTDRTAIYNNINNRWS